MAFRGGRLGFSIRMTLAFFLSKYLLPSFKSIGLSVFNGEAQNRLSRWPPWRPSWISNWNDFRCFWSSSRPNPSYEVSSQLAFWFRSSSKQIFLFCSGSHLAHRSGRESPWQPNIPVIFDWNWPSGVGAVTVDDTWDHEWHNRHWPITIAYLEHFMIRWAKSITF